MLHCCNVPIMRGLTDSKKNDSDGVMSDERFAEIVIFGVLLMAMAAIISAHWRIDNANVRISVLEQALQAKGGK